MMVKQVQRTSDHIERGERFSAGAFWFIGGGILGLVATIVNSMIDAGFYAAIEHAVGRQACVEGFNPVEIYTMTAFAILSTFATGFWLWHVRVEVGSQSADDDPEWSRFQRRWFTTGIFLVFCLAAPAKWLYMLAIANCYGA